MNIEDDAYKFVVVPEDIRKFMIPSFLRQAASKACLTEDELSKKRIIDLLRSYLNVMSDEALEEAKSIGEGVTPNFPPILNDIALERFTFLYSILVSHAIRCAAIEGLILLSGKVKKIIPLNSDNPYEVYAMYIRLCVTAGLTEEATILFRNQYEFKKAIIFNNIYFNYLITDVPTRLSSLFVYMAKENVERVILSGKGITLPPDFVSEWVNQSGYKVVE